MHLVFSVEEAAVILNESTHRVRRLEKAGELKRLGGDKGKVRFSVFEIARYLEVGAAQVLELLPRKSGAA